MYEYDKKKDRFRPRHFTLDELHSWIWRLHNEICSRSSNVQNGTITYRGIRNVKLQSSFKVGTTFAFGGFLSTSTDINISKLFLKDSKTTDNNSKIIFFIKILNNGINSHKNIVDILMIFLYLLGRKKFYSLHAAFSLLPVLKIILK